MDQLLKTSTLAQTDSEIQAILFENDAFLSAIEEFQGANLCRDAFDLQRRLGKNIHKLHRLIQVKCELETRSSEHQTNNDQIDDMPDIN